MAAVVEKVSDGERIATFRFVNNDTDETSPVTKIDISDPADIDPNRQGQQPTSLRILRLWYSMGADPVDFYFGASANQLAWAFGQWCNGYIDFRGSGGIGPNDLTAAGFTGDLIIQMRGTFQAAADGYSFLVEFEKRYD